MSGVFGWIRRFIRELRRRRVIRVAVVYASVAFVILQLGEILVEPFSLPSWTLRLVTFLLILGFPLAVGLAWVYNITEEGLVRDVGEKQLPEIGPGGKPLTSTWVLIGLLLLLVSFLLYPRVFSSGEGASGEVSAADSSQIDERSIAVLPFEPLSSGEESETFARGMHDDLLTRLSNISDLKVISRTSVERFRDTDLPLPTIADSLGVRWVMEGGVLESGSQIQINAQLIDPESDAHVWADDYRRKLTAENLFAIQEEITDEIASALKAELTAGEQKRITEAPTENLQAYRFYAKGRSRLDTRLPKNIAKAADYFRRAVREDSTYALAWSGLADATALFPLYLPDSTDAPDIAPRKAARRALELDPDLAEAHASLGYLQGVATGIRSLRRAVELKPSYAQARHWLGLKLLHAGHLEEARGHLSIGVELAPHHNPARGILAYANICQGRYQKAFETLEEMRVVLSRVEASQWMLEVIERARFGALYGLNRFETAHKVASSRKAQAEDPERIAAWGARVGMTEVRLGDTVQARQRLSQLTAKDPAFSHGLLHAALGEEAAAFTKFEEVSDRFMSNWRNTIEFRYFYASALGPLREQPRYKKLIREVNRGLGLRPDGTVPKRNETAAQRHNDL